MAVSIPSDLVADVMRAADPTRLRSVSQRLEGVSNPGSTIHGDFAEALERQDQPVELAPLPLAVEGADSERADQAYKSFEQMVLRNVFELILPKEESGVYGGDVSSGVWRTMAADQLAVAFSRSGSVGIAGTLTEGTSTTAHRPAEVQGQWPYFMVDQIRSFSG